MKSLLIFSIISYYLENINNFILEFLKQKA